MTQLHEVAPSGDGLRRRWKNPNCEGSFRQLISALGGVAHKAAICQGHLDNGEEICAATAQLMWIIYEGLGAGLRRIALGQSSGVGGLGALGAVGADGARVGESKGEALDGAGGDEPEERVTPRQEGAAERRGRSTPGAVAPAASRSARPASIKTGTEGAKPRTGGAGSGPAHAGTDQRSDAGTDGTGPRTAPGGEGQAGSVRPVAAPGGEGQADGAGSRAAQSQVSSARPAAVQSASGSAAAQGGESGMASDMAAAAAPIDRPGSTIDWPGSTIDRPGPAPVGAASGRAEPAQACEERQDGEGPTWQADGLAEDNLMPAAVRALLRGQVVLAAPEPPPVDTRPPLASGLPHPGPEDVEHLLQLVGGSSSIHPEDLASLMAGPTVADMEVYERHIKYFDKYPGVIPLPKSMQPRWQQMSQPPDEGPEDPPPKGGPAGGRPAPGDSGPSASSDPPTGSSPPRGSGAPTSSASSDAAPPAGLDSPVPVSAATVPAATTVPASVDSSVVITSPAFTAIPAIPAAAPLPAAPRPASPHPAAPLPAAPLPAAPRPAAPPQVHLPPWLRPDDGKEYRPLPLPAIPIPLPPDFDDRVKNSTLSRVRSFAGTSVRPPQFNLLGTEITTERPVAVSTDGCFAMGLFGVPGYGKSYAKAVMIEGALYQTGVACALRAPLCAIVYHYHPDARVAPELLDSIWPNCEPPDVRRLFSDAIIPRGFPDVLVLTLPDHVEALRRQYPHCQVHGLKFSLADLGAAGLVILFAVQKPTQLYMKQVQQMLKALVRKTRGAPTIDELEQAIAAYPLQKSVRSLVEARLRVAREWIDDGRSVRSYVRPGRLIIVDVRDEWVDGDTAMTLFALANSALCLHADQNDAASAQNLLVVYDNKQIYLSSDDRVQTARCVRPTYRPTSSCCRRMPAVSR